METCNARIIGLTLTLVALGLAPTVWAFDSGSTGADGAFTPTVDTRLALPPDGVFNFTNVDIPSGVTVTFEPNTTNTPVTILASGDVNIAGVINLNGDWSAPVGAAGDGNLGDDGLPGIGGAGGFSGGRGGDPDPDRTGRGGAGLGPGGGEGGRLNTRTNGRGPGGGGGFGTPGAGVWSPVGTDPRAAGGPAYGSELLLPLIGGSGGGGGMGGAQFAGSGGGGGGGAILIAASGTVTLTGSIRARGGNAGESSGSGAGPVGGGGSGGGVRIVATGIAGNGAIDARGGTSPQSGSGGGGNGGDGRIRLEAEIFNRTAATTPAFTFGEPTSVFVSGLPALRIHQVAGIDVPEFPTGHADVVLPVGTENPVVVSFRTTNVPVGNTVRLTVTPAFGDVTAVVSPALTGTTESASASVSVNIPDGPSTLTAQTTYTIVASLGDALAPFAEGERVEQIRLTANARGKSVTTLITVSGREFTMPSRFPAMPGEAGRG